MIAHQIQVMEAADALAPLSHLVIGPRAAFPSRRSAPRDAARLLAFGRDIRQHLILERASRYTCDVLDR